MSKIEEIKENWNKLPKSVRITFILLVIAFIYDLVTGQTFSIVFCVCFLLFILAELFSWLFNEKKQ